MYSKIPLMFAIIFILLVNILLPNLVTSKDLSIDDFDELKRNEKYLYILFHSSNCKRCSQILFSWQLLEKKYVSNSIPKLTFGQVDCSIHRELCSREDIKEFPTIKLYVFLNSITSIEETYNSDDYDLTSLESFLLTKITKATDEQLEKKNQEPVEESEGFSIVTPKPNEGLYELNDDDSSLFLSQGQHFVNFYAPWCSHCQNLKPKWELIAKSLQNNERVKISQIDCSTNVYTCKVQFKIKEYPTLLWISNGKVIARYKGVHEIDNIKTFINSQLTDHELNVLLKKYSDMDAGIEDMEIDYRKKVSNVQLLDQDNFKTTIDSGPTFVHFTVPWSQHCRKMKSDWDRLSLRINNVKIAKVDCSISEKLCNQEKIDGYPTLFLYQNGKKLQEYDGTRSVDSFVEYLQQQIQQQPQSITAENKSEL